MKSVRSRTTALLSGLAAAGIALTACGGPPAADSDGKIDVVASTTVWGDVVREIGGDSVDVESIISDPAADPHSYESTPQDAARISDADLVVYNGGGYDEFIEQTISASGQDKPAIAAVPEEAGGHDHGHEHDHSGNEHVWYDLDLLPETAQRIADELGRLQPENAERFQQQAAAFRDRIGALQRKVADIAAAHGGEPVLVTDPIAHYLIESTELNDITPQSFVRAVEAESDPSAAAVAEIHNAIESGQARLLIYNPQTESPVTRNVRTAAEQKQLPIVEMTETLPEGQTYLQWMDAQISALQNALD